jgi:hypothetical protein
LLVFQKKGGTVVLAAGLAAPVLERMGMELGVMRFEMEGISGTALDFIAREGGVDDSGLRGM